MNADGTHPHTVLDDVPIGGFFGLSWSPDGQQIAFIKTGSVESYRGRGRLEVVDVSTGVVTRLTDLVGVESPAWQPT